MLIRGRIGLVLLASVVIAAAQNEKKLTARELFYTPIPAKPAAAKATSKPATKPVANAAKSEAKAVAKEAKVKANDEAKEGALPSHRPSTGLQQVSVTSDPGGIPLGLRYSLLKQNSDGEFVEVAPDTTFRSGDKIKLSVESNDGAYLYIVQQGSSKAWNVLFPNDDTDKGTNHVERGRRYTIPAGGRFTFDDQPGTERLFVVLSRRAEPDLEQMIYDLSGNKGISPSTSPSAAPPSGTPKMMLAQSWIDDSVVNRLRGQMISRDLVFEKVSDDKPAPSGKKEKAMYYGTQDRTANARIVIDLHLRHQ
jgi:hypothetical protein